MIDEEVISLFRKKFLTAVLFLLTAASSARANPLPADPPLPESGDVPALHALPGWREMVGVCVLSVCEEDLALEAAVKRAAEAELLKLDGVFVSDYLEDSSVIVSFVAFKERDSHGMQTGRIVYSFAYGTPDLDSSEGVTIALPRYLHHEPTLATRETLEGEIAANIENADRDFFKFLRQP